MFHLETHAHGSEPRAACTHLHAAQKSRRLKGLRATRAAARCLATGSGLALAGPMLHRTKEASADELPTVRLGDVLAGLSHALDITEGHPKGHAARTCLIGMRLSNI